jgi:hypothetical protein
MRLVIIKVMQPIAMAQRLLKIPVAVAVIRRLQLNGPLHSLVDDTQLSFIILYAFRTSIYTAIT